MICAITTPIYQVLCLQMVYGLGHLSALRQAGLALPRYYDDEDRARMDLQTCTDILLARLAHKKRLRLATLPARRIFSWKHGGKGTGIIEIGILQHPLIVGAC